MSRPGGVSLHWHVGAGQLSIVGTGGGAKGISMREAWLRRASVAGRAAADRGAEQRVCFLVGRLA